MCVDILVVHVWCVCLCVYLCAACECVIFSIACDCVACPCGVSGCVNVCGMWIHRYKYRCVDVPEVYAEVAVLSVYPYVMYGVVCGVVCMVFVY